MVPLGDSFAISVLGSGGGVAKAVLSILNQACADPNDPLHTVLRGAKIHLVDIKPQSSDEFSRLFPHLKEKLTFTLLDLGNLPAFREHLVQTAAKAVIDASRADTGKLVGCCNEAGVLYINSALETTSVNEDESLHGFRLTERYTRFEAAKSAFSNTTAIIGSGMNPGVVQWMALRLMQEDPARHPKACYVVEHDTSIYADKSLLHPKTLYTSWSVECFLDEAIDSYPMFVNHHIPHYLYEDVYAAEYKVTLGGNAFYGCLMPHEEALLLGSHFDMETGFIYRVNEHTTQLIRDHLPRVRELWDWERRVIDPSEGEVEGEDLVGVLLVYDDRETYLLNTMKSSEIYPKYKTNATYFQVACGIYAGLASLILDPLPPGAHYVDELLLHTPSRYGQYLGLYMKDFIAGTNDGSDGLLYQRRKRRVPPF